MARYTVSGLLISLAPSFRSLVLTLRPFGVILSLAAFVHPSLWASHCYRKLHLFFFPATMTKEGGKGDDMEMK